MFHVFQVNAEKKNTKTKNCFTSIPFFNGTSGTLEKSTTYLEQIAFCLEHLAQSSILLPSCRHLPETCTMNHAPRRQIMLTNQEILSIYRDERTYRVIAKEYGLPLNTISRIKNQSTKHYKELTEVLYGWGIPLPPISHSKETAAPGNDERAKETSSRPSKTNR